MGILAVSPYPPLNVNVFGNTSKEAFKRGVQISWCPNNLSYRIPSCKFRFRLAKFRLKFSSAYTPSWFTNGISLYFRGRKEEYRLVFTRYGGVAGSKVFPSPLFPSLLKSAPTKIRLLIRLPCLTKLAITLANTFSSFPSIS